MEVGKSPPPLLSTGSHASPAAAPIADEGANAATGPAAAPADHVAIASLDSQAALQILIAEVRSALVELLAESPAVVLALQRYAPMLDVVMSPAAHATNGATSSVIESFLHAAPPPSSDAEQWSLAAANLEDTLKLAIDRAVAIVATWRDVEPTVVDIAKQAQTQVLALIVDEPRSLLWLDPEWFGLRPQMQRYWRRRRRAQRRLSDPDYIQRQWEADEALCDEEHESQ